VTSLGDFLGKEAEAGHRLVEEDTRREHQDRVPKRQHVDGKFVIETAKLATQKTEGEGGHEERRDRAVGSERGFQTFFQPLLFSDTTLVMYT